MPTPNKNTKQAWNQLFSAPPQMMKWIIVCQTVMEHLQEQEPESLRQRARASSPAWARSSNPGSGGRRKAVKSSRKRQKVWRFLTLKLHLLNTVIL